MFLDLPSLSKKVFNIFHFTGTQSQETEKFETLAILEKL